MALAVTRRYREVLRQLASIGGQMDETEDVRAIRSMVAGALAWFRFTPRGAPDHLAILSAVREGWVLLANAAMRAKGYDGNVMDGVDGALDERLMSEHGPPFAVGPAVRYIVWVAHFTATHGKIPEALIIDGFEWFGRRAMEFVPILERAAPGVTAGLPEAIESFDQILANVFRHTPKRDQFARRLGCQAAVKVGTGWGDLVDELLEEACKVLDRHNAEKLVSARIETKHAAMVADLVMSEYWSECAAELEQLAILFEARSQTLCERCGALGRQLSRGGWLEVACEKHAHQA